MLIYLFNVKSLRVVSVCIEIGWLCRQGVLDLLLPDTNWIWWEQHVETKIIKNREEFQDAGLTSNYASYWKGESDKIKSSGFMKILSGSRSRRSRSQSLITKSLDIYGSRL